LQEQLPQEAVLNVDETGWRTNGAKRWIWALVAKPFVFYGVASTRGAEVLVSLLGTVFRGILCSDRWVVYLTYHSGRMQLCWAHWQESRKPTTGPELLLLGKTQFTLQRYDHPADTLARLQAIDKGNVEAGYWLARTYQALGAECYDRLEQSFPGSWCTHQLRAEGYNMHEAANDAIREYLLAIQLRPDEAELHEALGEVYLNKKSYDEAQAELERNLRLEPSRARTLCLLGRLYTGKRETEKAVPYLAKALRYQPDMPEAYSLLGTAYVRLGQYADAVPELEKAAALDFYGDVHYQLSLAYRKLGKAELANKALARSEELRRTSAARHQAMVSGVAEVE
jgi:tetratricopeptide (TPR) repeat protein